MKTLWKWIFGIIGAAIATVLGSWIYDNLFATQHHILAAIWNVICDFFTFEVSIWWVIGIIIILLIAMYIERMYYTAPEVTTNNREINVPQFVKEYTQDNFGSYTYKWKWQSYKYDFWYMIDLRQYCPHDDTPLDNQVCPRCKGVFPAGEHHEQIKALVADNIKKKYGNENISPPGESHIYIKG